MKTKRASSKFELWEVAHNLTTKRWIIWRAMYCGSVNMSATL